MALDAPIESDCAPLHGLIATLLAAAPDIRFMRDPTRGGVATVLNEIAEAAQVAIEIDEAGTPLRDEVRGFCEILGLDPLYLANEGKIVAIVPPDAGGGRARGHACAIRLAQAASVIGRVRPGEPGRVTMRTVFGGSRIVDMLVGEQLAAHLLKEPACTSFRSLAASSTSCAETAKGRKVRRVTVEIGELSGVVSNSIAFWFPEVARGTELAEAQPRNPRGRRRSRAARSAEPNFPLPPCSRVCPCGSYRFERLQGEELNIKSIELEEAPLMCANCGCQGDKATVLDLQTGDTTTITVLHQHESGTGHSHAAMTTIMTGTTTPTIITVRTTTLAIITRCMGIQPMNIRIRITRLGMPQ